VLAWTLCAGGWFSYSAAILDEGDERGRLFTNRLLEGGQHVLEVFFEDPSGLLAPWDDEVPFELNVQVLTLSEELYRYQKSLRLYQQGENDIFGMHSPAQVYSNVSNGAGIFAGFSYDAGISRTFAVGPHE